MSDSAAEGCAAVIVMVVFCALIAGAGWWWNGYECSAKAEASGVESDWGPVKGCMVKVKGRWVPYDRWRAVDE